MKRRPNLMVMSIVIVIASGVFFTSCKKDTGGTGAQTELSDADSLKYLMYQVMEKTFVDGGRDKTTNFPLYYWYDKVPVLNPMDYQDANALLDKIKSYTKDGSGKILDRYSFLDDGSALGEIQGTAGDIGMEVRYAQGPDSKVYLIVISVDKNSPAGKAGVQRGWVINTINNQSAAWDNGGPNYTRAVNAIYYDAQASFGFSDAGGNPLNLTLAKASYQLNPILFDTVYSVNGTNVGYFVFSTFSDVTDDNGAATLTKNEIDRVFNSFSSKNISSLIVDLRYNGGGEVSTSEYLCNKIAPSSTNGKEMYHTVFNNLLMTELQNEGYPNKIFFKGTGNLNLQNVFFIGSGSTASASELTYNNLRPYMNVKLVGDTTYGKPVGSWVFPISIYKNKVETVLSYLFAITFESKNSAGQGGYFNGLTPDAAATDFINIPWGNVNDDNLKKIFNYISTGSYGRLTSSERMQQDPALRQTISVKVPSIRFNGMVQKTEVKKFR